MFESEMGRPGIHRGRRRPIVARGRHHGARHINVPRDSSTIQEAIQGANQGDTIHVEPQTYTEQITIDKDITLIGAGANSTIIQSPKVLSPDNFGKKFIVEIRQGANVIMSGFTIRGPDGSPHWGIGVLDGSTLGIKPCNRHTNSSKSCSLWRHWCLSRPTALGGRRTSRKCNNISRGCL